MKKKFKSLVATGVIAVVVSMSAVSAMACDGGFQGGCNSAIQSCPGEEVNNIVMTGWAAMVTVGLGVIFDILAPIAE